MHDLIGYHVLLCSFLFALFVLLHQAQSMLVFVTQAGIVHGWDLRARREVWCCIVPPDLGYPTAIELGPDNCWFVLGTHRGFLCVWDTRFQIMVKCFQHSSACPIRALRFCPPRQRWMQVGRVAWEVPTVYVAVGNNEVSRHSIVCIAASPASTITLCAHIHSLCLLTPTR